MLRGAVGLVEKLTCRYIQKSTSLQLLLLTLYRFISLQECVAVLSGKCSDLQIFWVQMTN